MSRHKSWPEKKLWAKIKNNQLGVAIHSQKAMYGYIADFWCPKAKLIIETDGKYHLQKAMVESDKNRDAVFASHGIKTIRFTASEVFVNLPAVVAMIRAEISKNIGK